MKCPECGRVTFVLSTRDIEGDYTRRRACTVDHRFTTREVVVPDTLRTGPAHTKKQEKPYV